MTEGVIVALIGAVVAIAAPGGFAAVLLNRKVNAIRHQVANHHEVNLRDDLDAKHVDNTMLLETIARDVGGMKSDLRLIRRTQASQGDRILSLEKKGKP